MPYCKNRKPVNITEELGMELIGAFLDIYCHSNGTQYCKTTRKRTGLMCKGFNVIGNVLHVLNFNKQVVKMKKKKGCKK
jgi:hypothetical protein